KGAPLLMAHVRISNPDVGFLITPQIPRSIDDDRTERAGHGVLSAFGKTHARPFLPPAHCLGNNHGARGQTEYAGPKPPMNAQPGIERLPVLSFPLDILFHRHARVLAL